MNKNIKIKRNNEYDTTRWSGGTTTQLLIYPEDAQYSKQNFKWRVSSAKVEDEKSTFTHLPGISRIIMIIDGKTTLEHEGKYKVELGPFEQDSFMGDWTTKSVGKVTDFNLMMAKDCDGKIDVVTIKGKENVTLFLDEYDKKFDKITDIFYIISGDIILNTDNKKVQLNQKDSFYITRSLNDKGKAYRINLSNENDKDIKIIKTTIFY